MSVRTPEAALAWLVTPPGVPSTVEVTRDGSSFIVRGLEPAASFDVEVETLSASGWQRERIGIQTHSSATSPASPEGARPSPRTTKSVATSSAAR